ncbi:MAG: sigma-70 family RNA polymerase sigma factor [Archangium sp.]|nr:sigma-70 family RNA polymerase sigma factor [Archangium sp.]
MSAFPTTRWTLILAARESPEARAEAWRHLLSTYWPSLYALFRARGLDGTAAADAVQGLCLELLERDVVDQLNPERGRLRGFLKVAAENFLIRQHEKATAQKRGGEARPLELDLALGERLADPSLTPDLAFERAWAVAVFERSMKSLEQEWSSRAGDFELIRRFFSPREEPPAYRDAAAEFGVSIPQLKSLLHRARLRFRELVEAEVAHTVGEGAELQTEVSSLLDSLSR